MLEFCRCGKPVKKAGRCAACYEVDQRARRKQESEAIHLEMVNTGFEDLLRSQLIPLFKQETDELITKWTEKNIVLPDGEGFFSISAPNWDFAPEMQFIFEQLKNPDVKEIYLQFGSQSSKTLFEICAISWFIADRKVNGMFVPPDERLIKRLQVRMSNIWEKSKIMNYEPKKGGKEFSSFGTNRVAWGLATSPSSLAEMPADFVVFDEIDEIKPQDVNPIQLARSRGRTKPNFKLILASTPKLLEGNGGIQDYYNNSKRYAIEMQCPHCKEWSEFTEECISAEDGADYREIEAKGLGFAICPSNGCEIRDESHEQMVVTQRWKDLDPDLPHTYVGFHKASWNTIHNDFSSIAAKRIKAREEGTNSFKDFYNSECAKPSDLDALGGDIGQTELALEKYNRKEIPEDVKSITIGIDVGTDRVYCVVIGWAPDNKTYQIYEQEISWDNRDWEKVERGIGHLLDDISRFKYLGTGLRPQFVAGAMDSGYRANLVYDFCRRNPLWIPVKGRHPLNRPWVINPADPAKKMGRQAHGVKLYTLNSYHWQDVMQTALERPADSAGSFNLPFDFHGRYLDHLNGEVKKLRKNAQGLQVEVWEKKSRTSKNDYRDATIYGMVRGYTIDLDKLRAPIKKAEAIINRIPEHNPNVRGTIRRR